MFAVNAVGALRNMAANNTLCQDAIRATGAIPTLLHLLSSGPETQVGCCTRGATYNSQHTFVTQQSGHITTQKTHAHARVHTHTYTHTQRQTKRHTHKHTHRCMHAHAHTLTHACTDMRS
jgi:hypothetical protein